MSWRRFSIYVSAGNDLVEFTEKPVQVSNVVMIQYNFSLAHDTGPNVHKY